MEIDQEDALQLLERCGLLIIAGVPDKTEFGKSLLFPKQLEFSNVFVFQESICIRFQLLRISEVSR